MSIKTEIQCIGLELTAIKESEKRMKSYILELNKLNPLAIGQDLIVNDYSHHGKTIVARDVFVSDSMGRNAAFTANEPINFTAVGAVKKKDGSPGSYTGVHSVSIKDFI